MSRSDTIELCGRTWQRVPGHSTLLESVEGSPVRLTEDRIKRLHDDRKAEEAKLAKERAEAARKDAAFYAQEPLVVCNDEWRPVIGADDRAMMMNSRRSVVLSEGTLRRMERDRAEEARQAAERAAVRPVDAQIAELRAQLAALVA